MKHIHFVIYRLKSIIFCYLFLFINSFLLFYLEIEFIKPLDDVEIQRKTITFTKDYTFRTIFINKMINSGIMRMFIYFYNFYIYIFYFVSQVLCIRIDDRYGNFSMWNICLFFNNLMRYWYCIWIETKGPQRWSVQKS
jgi:hypothetical protein